MRVALYARVSKDEADSSGAFQNPENQLVPLRKYCEAMDYNVSREYVDYMTGGVANRPEFQNMMSGVRQRHFDIVIVWALDRFSREGARQMLNYLNQLKQYKTDLRSLQESWVTTQEGIGDILIAFTAWWAAEERRKISERTKAALERKKGEGIRLGRPLGWRKSQVKGVPNPKYKNFPKAEAI